VTKALGLGVTCKIGAPSNGTAQRQIGVNTRPGSGLFRLFGPSSTRNDRGMENIDDARRGPRRSSPIWHLLERLAASVPVSSAVEIVAVSKRAQFGHSVGNAVEHGVRVDSHSKVDEGCPDTFAIDSLLMSPIPESRGSPMRGADQCGP
jgi:hypothetical protein